MASTSRVKSLIVRASTAAERRTMRQAFWMGTALAVQVLSGLAMMSLYARILGVEGLGILSVLFAVTGLIYGFAAMPGGNVITIFATRAVAEGRPDEGVRVFRFALAASLGPALIAYAVLVGLTFTAGHLLNIGEDAKDIMLLYGSVGVLTAMNMEALAVLRLADRVQLHLLVTVASRLAGVGLLAAVWSTGGGMTEVVLVNVAMAAVDGLGMFAAAALSAPLAGLSGFLRSASFKVPPDMARFYAGAFWNLKITNLVDNMDVILLAQFAGAADVGLYRPARRIVDMARHPIGLIPNAVKPEYSSQWYTGQGAALRRTTLRVTVLASALAVAGFGLLAVFREPIIRLVLGEEFSGVAPLMLILILGALPTAAAYRLLPEATGRIGPSLLSGIARLAVFLAAMAWLVPKYGAAGTAWARTLSALVGVLVITPFAISILRQSYRLRRPQHQGEAEVSLSSSERKVKLPRR